ncbi:MAG: KilA-N domain-containing protein [Christensenellales bacterium]
MKNKEITVLNQEIHINKDDYFSLTDIARYKNPEDPADVVKNWLRRKDTIAFIGLWEKLNNPNFKVVEFDQFKNEAGHNYFTLSPKKWIDGVNAIGIISKAGKYNSGTYAHKDIALQFASWISPEINLYIIKEFQRLKADEQKQLGWTVKRELAKINYRIHTDAIKDNIIIPLEISKEQASFVYANEADVLNVALFGMTAREWREKNPDKKGNIRDYAEVSQLVCLSNLENLNAYLIDRGLSQRERLIELNKTAIRQMKVLAEEAPGLPDGSDENN